MSLTLYAVGWALALGAFERTPSASEGALVSVGAAAGFPLIYALTPALANVAPSGVALLTATVMNSVLWGYVLASGLNLGRHLRQR